MPKVLRCTSSGGRQEFNRAIGKGAVFVVSSAPELNRDSGWVCFLFFGSKTELQQTIQLIKVHAVMAA